MFRNAQIGDRVWDYERDCWGTIISINNECHYPLKVKLDNKYSEELYYTINGKSSTRNVNPSLFWNVIKFEISEKPFDLEKELRKLEVQEFKVAERNHFLIWDNADKNIYHDAVGNNEQPNIKYFTEQSISNFMKNIKGKKITKEDFFSAYKKVFG